MRRARGDRWLDGFGRTGRLAAAGGGREEHEQDRRSAVAHKIVFYPSVL